MVLYAPMFRWRIAEAGGVLIGAVALTAALTYPVAFRIDRVGRLNADDGQFSLWNVAWVSHALLTDPATLYDTNIFYPHRGTLAFSEANIVAGVMGLPAYWITGNPFATLNTAMLLGFVLAFLSAYGLARHLTGHPGAAVTAAIAFAFCPFVFARTPHIQLMLTFGMPLSLLCLHRFVQTSTPRRAVQLGLALFVQAMACAYYGIFAGLAVATGVLFYATVRKRWTDRRYWSGVVLGAAVSVGLVTPFFLPYWDLRAAGFARSLDEAVFYAADWQSWLASSAWAHRWMLPLLGRWKDVLFPGFLTTALGLLGFWMAVLARPARPSGGLAPAGGAAAPPLRESACFYGALGGLAAWASFGPQAGLYTLLFSTLPILSFLRVPARIGILVALALAVLAAMALTLLAQRRERLGRALLMLAPVLLALELASIPLGMQEAEPVNAAYRFLATAPRGPVVEFPFHYLERRLHYHARYLFNSTAHWQPLVNGYSDYIPQDFREMAEPLSAFPTPESFRILQEKRARYVVFHLGWYTDRDRDATLERLETYKQHLRRLTSDEDVWLFEIVGWPD